MNSDPYRTNSKSKIIVPIIIILLLLLLGWLIWSLLSKAGNDTAQNNNSTAQSPPQQSTNQPQPQSITSLDALLSSTDTQNIIGRKVDIQKVPVNTVIGDKSFTIGTADKYAYALLADQLNSGQTEQAVQVKAGEQRSIQGTVVKAPDDTASLAQQFQLNEQQASDLKAKGYYITVTSTSVQQ